MTRMRRSDSRGHGASRANARSGSNFADGAGAGCHDELLIETTLFVSMRHYAGTWQVSIGPAA
jgi:hypothetical protein